MFSQYLMMAAPSTGPSSVPAPPRMVISTTSPDAVHCIRSAPASGSVTASSDPASPAYMPEMTKAASVSGFVLNPVSPFIVLFDLIASSIMPNGEWLDRQRVGEGQSGDVRVSLCGRL